MAERCARKSGGLLALAAATLALAASQPVGSGPTSWSDRDLDYVLGHYVSADGRVDYEGLVRDREPLDRYVAQLARVSPDSDPALFPTREAALAYWMNAYNALMLQRVVEAWPVASVKEIRPLFGVFWLERHRLGGESRTLRGLENKVIRARFDDPRVHFAINCASAGCPDMPRRAWRADTLDEDLDEAARRFVGEERNVRIDAERGAIHLSSIFKWYARDFTDWLERQQLPHARGVLDYVLRYLPPQRLQGVDVDRLEVQWIDYDWSVNAWHPPSGASSADRSEERP